MAEELKKSDTIDVWFVRANGTGYFEDKPENILDMIKDMDVDSSYGISKRRLDR